MPKSEVRRDWTSINTDIVCSRRKREKEMIGPLRQVGRSRALRVELERTR